MEGGGYQDERWWSAEDWRWIQSEGVAHPIFWERSGDDWYWRGMFDRIPLPSSWPVYVTYVEASAFARWRLMRLPTESEFQRAAYGSPNGDRLHPWGHDEPSPSTGVFDLASWDPEPAGSHPGGASAWGIQDLVGNGWEWTSTPFAPFPGFQARPSYPEYSADFFDGRHFVIKGASPVTASELLRPTFRNWFRRATRTFMPHSAASGTTLTDHRGFAEDVAYYLSLTPRQLPSRYLYDELGSVLFEAITRLPWYRISGAENHLLSVRAGDILARMRPLSTIVELGPGSGRKLATLWGARISARV